MKRISFLAIFFVIASLGAIHAQQRTGFAYYDLDRLYDTIPSLFYDDTDYTPEGRLRWSGERYRAKVERAGAVIGRMAMPLAGVYGVENEEVVKDLVRASDLPYSYVHRTLNTLDGMDFALLYYADRFFTERIETGYGYLCVEGTLDGKPTAVLLTRGDRYAAELLEELRERTPGIRILCAGKLPSGTAEKLSLRDALAPAERRGRGNAYARGGWWLHDRILTDTALTVIRADVFARRDLLDPRSGTPCRPIGDNAIRVASADIFQYFYILNKFLIIRKIIVSFAPPEKTVFSPLPSQWKASPAARRKQL